MASHTLRRPLLLLLLHLPYLVFFTGVASGTPVLDTDGNPVLRGVFYYVRAPQARGLGNLGLSPPDGSSCPLNVYVKPFPFGPAAVFFPERSQGNSSILVGEDLSVIFVAPTACSDSTQWRLDEKTGVVTTGGKLSPPSEASYSRFRIARYEFPNRNFYQFLSCPAKDLACSTLGVTTRQFLRRTTEVLLVSFIKVKEGSV